MEKEHLLQILGTRIRGIRKENKVSQLQLAHRIGKDQQSIQRLEAGGINPSFYYLYEISVGLGISLSALVQDTVKQIDP